MADLTYQVEKPILSKTKAKHSKASQVTQNSMLVIIFYG
jgi:hypothetical protein